jgi:hypothetical protein
MSIGIRQRGHSGNASISLLPATKGGSDHPHSIAPLVTSGGSRIVSLLVKGRYLQQNRWRIALAALITKVALAPQPVESPGE